MSARFGVAPAGAQAPNLFTSDVEFTRSEYISTTNVTDFTFSGSEGQSMLSVLDLVVMHLNSWYRVILYSSQIQTTIWLKPLYNSFTKPEGVKKSRIYLDSLLPEDVASTTVIRVRPTVTMYLSLP